MSLIFGNTLVCQDSFGDIKHMIQYESNKIIFISPWSLDYFLTKIIYKRSSWSWSYGSWIYNNLCNQYLSPLMLWVRIPLRRGVLNTTLCTPVSSDNKTDCHDITEILLKVTLITINQLEIVLSVLMFFKSVYIISLDHTIYPSFK